MAHSSSKALTPSQSIQGAGCTWRSHQQSPAGSILSGELLAIWTHWGRPSGIRIVGDTLYAVDSESRAAVGEYGYNPGWHRGIYVGHLDGTITDLFPTPAPAADQFSRRHGVSDEGVIWGASVGDREVLKFVRR